MSSRIFVLAAYSLLRRASSLSRPLASLPSLCTVRLSVVSSGPPVQLGVPLPSLVVCRHSLVLHQAVDLGAILYPGGRPAASHALVLLTRRSTWVPFFSSPPGGRPGDTARVGTSRPVSAGVLRTVILKERERVHRWTPPGVEPRSCQTAFACSRDGSIRGRLLF